MNASKTFDPRGAPWILQSTRLSAISSGASAKAFFEAFRGMMVKSRVNGHVPDAVFTRSRDCPFLFPPFECSSAGLRKSASIL